MINSQTKQNLIYSQARRWLKLQNNEGIWEIGPIELIFNEWDWPTGPWWVRFPDEWMSVTRWAHDSGWRSVDRRTAKALLHAAEVYSQQDK